MTVNGWIGCCYDRGELASGWDLNKTKLGRKSTGQRAERVCYKQKIQFWAEHFLQRTSDRFSPHIRTLSEANSVF